MSTIRIGFCTATFAGILHSFQEASADEEVLSSNEELQSTNEDLDTAKEELQRTNEELNTLNAELRSRNDELSRLNSDLINLLSSVQLAVIMVDRAARAALLRTRRAGGVSHPR